MKKILSALFAIVLVIAALFAAQHYLIAKENAATGTSGSSAKVLNIYNWGDYIDPSLITKFTKETGYQVNYETFDSNEAMYTKVKQGGTAYDIIVPSDYMVEKMRRENLLLPIDEKKFTALKYYDKRFLNKSFDPGNKYSIPYFWGTLGIIYNDKFVRKSEVQHWDQLWSSRFRSKILLVDSARDDFAFSLISMGKSVNDKNSATVQAAKAKLDALMPNVKAILDDEIVMYMAQEEAPVGVTWSGEAAEMIAENKHLHYVIPKEGSNIWFDNLAIPKTAKHFKAIYKFLNFMSEPKNAAQNAEYVEYATPNKAARKLLPKAITGDKQFYPDDQTIKNLYVYSDLGPKWTQIYNDLFLEFKMTNH
ncbi:ABC transporter substrate-binding protein [Oenococcus sicerae]|uniref:ABC transporter substrate-binding protein n=1 Tax=Oenococcus sicerae TaxID=2203724 RepID=A0ABX5QN32_9LACO|nr:ABC transporter substrate-binding protein [Oenococcus sicerae]QAS70075.1 ABC transporter substrate-binding protein [Oenococcus sicerae]